MVLYFKTAEYTFFSNVCDTLTKIDNMLCHKTIYFQSLNHTEYSLTITELKLEISNNKIFRNPSFLNLKLNILLNNT